MNDNDNATVGRSSGADRRGLRVSTRSGLVLAFLIAGCSGASRNVHIGATTCPDDPITHEHEPWGKTRSQIVDGLTVTLRDCLSEGNAYIRVSDGVATVRPEYFLFGYTLYEEIGWVLLNLRSGDLLDLYGPPVFSSDGERFAVASDDVVAGYVASGLKIFEVTPDRAAEEYAADGENEWGAVDPTWTGRDRLTFGRVQWADSVTARRLLDTIPYVAELGVDGWTLRPQEVP